uniref:Uncharacterized protein n=2 Tax=viral metagenome TaxID=1070528 RepID=A0A6M3LS83_9ZZZZ
MSKYTKAPWRIDGTKIIAIDDTIVIDCYSAMSGSDSNADKRLMAKAPEMYELLKEYATPQLLLTLSELNEWQINFLTKVHKLIEQIDGE